MLSSWASFHPTNNLGTPAHTLGSCVAELGEAATLADLKDFCDYVVASTPYTPELIPTLGSAPDLFGRLFNNYLARASSSQWGDSNPFAVAVPALDAPLAALVTDEQAFKLLAAIKKGAEWSGHGPRALVNTSFATLPALKLKAHAFANADPAAASALLEKRNVEVTLVTFLSDHLN